MGKSFQIDEHYNPHTWEVPGGDQIRPVDKKTEPASTLYPELNQYRKLQGTARYTDRDFSKREWQLMWSKTWHSAGRIKDLPKEGSYFRYNIGPESVIVTRTQSGDIKAHYNACQHRGRQLIENDFGQRKQFVCPFHSWSYDLDGTNTRVTDPSVFSEEATCGNLNLRSVRCETWGGFVFVNFDENAQSLAEFLGPVPELMSSYRLEDMHVVYDVLLPVECNWKIGLEAFLEAYHVHITHPQALPLLDDVYEQSDVFVNGHSRLATRLGVQSPRMGTPESLTDELAFLLMDAGVDPATFSGGIEDIRSAICAAKRHPENRFGLDYSAFSDTQMLDDWNYFLFPNMTLNTHPEGVSVMRFLPHESDPEKMYYHVTIIVPKLKDGCGAPWYMGVPEGTDISGETRPERIYADMSNPKIGEIFEQDMSNMEATQRGLRSAGFSEGMRFSEREMRLQVLHAEIDRYLKRGPLPAKAAL
jgi:phenylpropionate dioxygenase-like ring-hydroxylating dioxygenase large terminal subunit